MNKNMSEWDKDKYITESQVRSMEIKKYNKPLTSRRCYTKCIKDSQILDLVGLAQKLADDSNKSFDK